MKNELTPEEQLEEIANICSEHLVNLVDLKWQLNSSAHSAINSTNSTDQAGADGCSTKIIKGKASLGGLRISRTMLSLLHMPPIEFQLDLNQDPWPAERAEFICVLGDTLSVAVTLYNALELDLGPLKLQVSVYQDMQNGTFNRRLGKIIIKIISLILF